MTSISEDNVTVELLSSSGTQLVTSGDLGTTRTYTINHSETSGGTYNYTVRLTDGSGNTTDYAVNGVVIIVLFRYLAFWGEHRVSNDNATFQEIELTLGTPLNGFSEIKYGVNDAGITFYPSKSWTYRLNRNNYNTIMNGIKSLDNPNDNEKLHFEVSSDAIYWYMDLGVGITADVSGGTFWTYNQITNDFLSGKLYGTNTDPATFADASLVSNYEFVCDLNKQISG